VSGLGVDRGADAEEEVGTGRSFEVVAEYDVPAELPPDILKRVGSCTDLTEE